MFLHNDNELFRDVIVSTSKSLRKPIEIIEKDYYVTMILKQFSQLEVNCVFKGGTSLSKCHHIIDRFSEDIDIAFSKKINSNARKKLKNESILDISKVLNLPITNWEDTRSRRDYNCYIYSYETAIEK